MAKKIRAKIGLTKKQYNDRVEQEKFEYEQRVFMLEQRAQKRDRLKHGSLTFWGKCYDKVMFFLKTILPI